MLLFQSFNYEPAMPRFHLMISSLSVIASCLLFGSTPLLREIHVLAVPLPLAVVQQMSLAGLCIMLPNHILCQRLLPVPR